MAVEFSLFLPQMRMSFATILERARCAEAAGWDGISLMDHLAPPALPTPLPGWTLPSGHPFPPHWHAGRRGAGGRGREKDGKGGEHLLRSRTGPSRGSSIRPTVGSA